MQQVYLTEKRNVYQYVADKFGLLQGSEKKVKGSRGEEGEGDLKYQ